MKKKTHILFLVVLCALPLMSGCKDKEASRETQGSSVQGNNRWRTMVVKRSGTDSPIPGDAVKKKEKQQGAHFPIEWI